MKAQKRQVLEKTSKSGNTEIDKQKIRLVRVTLKQETVDTPTVWED